MSPCHPERTFCTLHRRSLVLLLCQQVCQQERYRSSQSGANSGAGKNASSFRTERTGPPGGGPVRVSPPGYSRSHPSTIRPRAETHIRSRFLGDLYPLPSRRGSLAESSGAAPCTRFPPTGSSPDFPRGALRRAPSGFAAFLRRPCFPSLHSHLCFAMRAHIGSRGRHARAVGRHAPGMSPR